MIYGYCRVSTVGQGKDGNSLEDQEAKLREAGCREIYKEVFTGKTNDRPKFNELIERLQSGDTIVVTKLDRFSRSACEGLKAVQDLVARGVNVNVLNLGYASKDSTSNLLITILLAFAEFERNQIIERTQAGKAVAKANGKKTDGRYKTELPMFGDFYEKWKNGEKSVKECCEEMNISRSLWYKRIREEYA